MIASKCLALLFSFVILANAIVVRRIVGTWLFPAVLFALFWFALTFLPLVCLFTVPVNPWSVALIACGSIAFSIGALIYFRWKRAFRLNRRKPPAVDYFNTPFMRALFYGAALLSLLCFFLNMAAQGFKLQSMWLGMFETATEYARLRYAEELEVSLYSKLSLAFAYLAITTGGLLFGSSRSKRQSVLTLVGAFLPALAGMLFQSAKGLLFLFVALFFGGILVTRIFAGRLFLMDRATMRATAWALAVIVPLTVISFLSRGLYALDDSSIVKEAMSQYALTYAFGHLYAFSDWFSYRLGEVASLRYPADPTGYGFYTFMPIFKLLGSAREVPLGTYDDMYTYGTILITNIFTIYRGLIIDFGMLGALVYMFVSGFAIHLSFYFLLVQRKPVVHVAVFIFAVGYFYLSALISLWASNIAPFSLLVLSSALYLNNWSRRLWRDRQP